MRNALDNLAINGRFLTRTPTGVDRTAYEMTCALADMSAQNGVQPPKIVVPTDAQTIIPFPFAMPVQALGKVRRGGGAFWEQSSLAALPKDQMLLNFCNTGPMLRRHQAVMIHDAQVWSSPESYSASFRNWYRLLLPILARRADVVFTVSDYSRKTLEHFGVVPRGKANVIANGADHILRVQPDTTVLARHGLTNRGYFLAIASNHKHKNIDLLETLPTDRPIVLAGGAQRADKGNLVSIGRVSEGELRALYAFAQALLFPSLTEGFGLPPLEAMALGTPVISSTGGALPDTCGQAAMFANPSDANEWTTCIRRLNGSSQLWDELSAMGTEHAAKYTWARSADLIRHHLSEASGISR